MFSFGAWDFTICSRKSDHLGLLLWLYWSMDLIHQDHLYWYLWWLIDLYLKHSWNKLPWPIIDETAAWVWECQIYANEPCAFTTTGNLFKWPSERRTTCDSGCATTDSSGGPIDVAYVARGKVQGWDTSNVQGYNYQKYGHFANKCKQKFCTYCKGKGHVFLECRKRPQYRPQQMYDATVDESSSASTPPAAYLTMSATVHLILLLNIFSFFDSRNGPIDDNQCILCS